MAEISIIHKIMFCPISLFCRIFPWKWRPSVNMYIINWNQAGSGGSIEREPVNNWILPDQPWEKMFEPNHSSIDVYELYKSRRWTDIETQKLWNGQSGSCLPRIKGNLCTIRNQREKQLRVFGTCFFLLRDFMQQCLLNVEIKKKRKKHRHSKPLQILQQISNLYYNV